MKLRLDQLLLKNNLASTLEKAHAIIYAGEIFINEECADKPGLLFDQNVSIRQKKKCTFVSRGGMKLLHGLNHFTINVANKICIDIGASTGGFTDCLLQHGAKKVFAIDVAYGQLAWKIRQDSRVEVIERFNARNITPTNINKEPVDLAVIDVSFISLTKIISVLPPLFAHNVAILALIKPQFELPKVDVGEGGIITMPTLHQKAIKKVVKCLDQLQLHSAGVIDSPILGPKGNKEFLIHITSKIE